MENIGNQHQDKKVILNRAINHFCEDLLKSYTIAE